MAGSQVGVVGAGTMGIGIAITVARAGYQVVLHDISKDRLNEGRQHFEGFLCRSVELGKLSSEQRDNAIAQLESTEELGGLSNCSVVIEAVYEDLELKQNVFAQLDSVCDRGTLFHTNTSTLSATAIAAGSAYPERVVGTHYCNPAPLMRLVEVVRARQTSEVAHSQTLEFVRSLDKTPVAVRDTPGLLVNYFLVPFENDCIRALEAGIGTIESIDTAVKLGLGHPMGPFRLLDIVGLDVHQAVSSSLYEQLHDPRFAAPPLVERMVSAGHLGRKTGQGFYSYEAEGN